ncbi:MAG TPA: DUF4239 domain-containing protein [Acetobacteraceae bacterium]|nr:DUF4239 domain-containing protein [Acetobacteraceae bacterium]
MNLSDAALVTIGSTLVAGVAAVLARRVLPLDVRRRHHDVGIAVFLQLGVVYAVLLAFVFSGVWDGYNQAAEAINEECASLHGVAILAGTLPAPAAVPVERAIATYLRDVADAEWPAMTGRRAMSPAASEAFRILWQTIATTQAAGEQQVSTRAEMMTLLATAHQQRETRLFQINLVVPRAVWILLIVLSVILVGFVISSGVEYPGSHAALAALFAGSLTLFLVTVSLLDRPFEGVLRLQPTDFQDTLGKVVRLLSAVSGGPGPG